MRTSGLVAFLLIGFLTSARADEPLAEPARYATWSPNAAWCAVVDPAKGTRVYKVGPKGSRKLAWKSKQWHRAFYLADDGEHAAAMYDGLNLLPLDYDPDAALVTFFRRGEELARVRARDLFPDGKGLRRTISHLSWGFVEGFGAEGLIVEIGDGSSWLVFDPKTGKLLRTAHELPKQDISPAPARCKDEPEPPEDVPVLIR